MSNHIQIKATEVDRAIIQDARAATLEMLLGALSKYGKPRVSLLSTGWYCAVDMYVGSKGVEFKIDSECRHDTPQAAARECCERLADVLRNMGI